MQKPAQIAFTLRPLASTDAARTRCTTARS